MRQTAHKLLPTDFPAIHRGRTTTLQVNVGLKCNQSCVHCHVNAGPSRTEMMSRETIDDVLAVLRKGGYEILDLTGGAPELNPHFRYLVDAARRAGVHVIDRCNLTILEEETQQDLAEFLASRQVEIVASLPCYLQENVDRQRGKGVFDSSVLGLRRLNALGYGMSGSNLKLNLVYNPQGPTLPPSQKSLEADYKVELKQRFGVDFNALLTLTNMPIQRFGSVLESKGQFDDYLLLLKENFHASNLPDVMCRTLVSVDWQGRLYDCDFNQMLEMPIAGAQGGMSVRDLLNESLEDRAVRVAEHCYGCTAGNGSSCGGALS